MGAVAAVVKAGIGTVAVFAAAGSAFALSPPPQLELRASTLPTLEATDGAVRSSRVDVTLLPRKRSAFGLAFGMSQLSGTNPALAPSILAVPSMDFGVHWRLMLDSNYRFDVTAYRRVANADAISLIESREPEYGARVELGLGSIGNRSKGFVTGRGFLGFQLEGGARISVKRKSGGPMFYYRNTF